MKKIKYFFEFLIISFLFIAYKFLGLKISSYISGKLFEAFGPIFRSKNIIKSNIEKAIPKISSLKVKIITKNMWNNYGRTLSEYMFLKGFRNNKFESNIKIVGKEILEKIKLENAPVIFISGHFSNFELMAMEIEKSGINLSAIYRPLNNIFLNVLMEKIRKKYICKNQIKKGINGVREAIEFIKEKHCIALMIDQRVTEGEKVNFFGKQALTTTLPAQLAIKYNLEIVPVFIERVKNNNFKIEYQKEINPKDFKNKLELTKKLNKVLENMLVRNPSQWIWTHNRWK